MTAKKRRKKRTSLPLWAATKDWLKAFFLALGLLIFLRFFLFDLHSYSGSSMEQTILPGDVLWVNKVRYGPRMPLRLIPQSWVNLLLTTDSLTPARQLPYWRIRGNEYPRINDLVLLNAPAPHHVPIDRRSRKIKRVVGLPGNKIELKDANVFINEEPVENVSNLKWYYLLELQRSVNQQQWIEEQALANVVRQAGHNRFVVNTTRKMSDSLAGLDQVVSVSKLKAHNPDDLNPPFGTIAKDWGPDDYGPLYIPHKGYTIELDSSVVDFYGYHIRYHERNHLRVSNDSVFVDGDYAASYTFRNNYYFVLGDNRHNTSDSRMWGLVPESHMVGRVSRVFVSFDKSAGLFKKIRWSRWGKKIGHFE